MEMCTQTMKHITNIKSSLFKLLQKSHPQNRATNTIVRIKHQLFFTTILTLSLHCQLFLPTLFQIYQSFYSKLDLYVIKYIYMETQNRHCKHHVYLHSHLPVSFVQEKHLCHPNSENKIYTYVATIIT